MARMNPAGGGWTTTWRGTALLAVALAAVAAALFAWAPWKDRQVDPAQHLEGAVAHLGPVDDDERLGRGDARPGAIGRGRRRLGAASSG